MQSNSDIQAENYLKDGFSVFDIFSIIKSNWKLLALSALLGGILGFCMWISEENYSSEVYIINSQGEQGISMLTAKELQKSLPALAGQMLEEKKVPINLVPMYKKFCDERWWQKNFKALYGISKTDVKDLVLNGKEISTPPNQIGAFTITGKAFTKEELLNKNNAALKFFKSGSMYLQFKKTLRRFKADLDYQELYSKDTILRNQIDVADLQVRSQKLEELQKLFPVNDKDDQLFSNLTDSSVKYLPLKTQIIALNIDIAQKKEANLRYWQKLQEIRISKLFIEDAISYQENTYDGVLLGSQLRELAERYNAGSANGNAEGKIFLSNFLLELNLVQAPFENFIVINNGTNVIQTNPFIHIAISSAFLFFVGLLALLRKYIWQRIKR